MSTKEDVLGDNKNQALLKNNEGTQLFQADDLEGAIRAFTEAIREDPRFETAYHNRAMAYRKVGKHREADLDLYQVSSIQKVQERESAQGEKQEKKTVRETDKLAIIANDEGLRLLGAGDFQGSIKAFTEAIERDPRLESAYRNRAQAYRRLGMIQEAESDLQHVDSRGLSLSSVGMPKLGISSSAELFEKVAYILAIILAIGFAIFIWAILGPIGVLTLFGGALFVWAIKWGWIWFLK